MQLTNPGNGTKSDQTLYLVFVHLITYKAKVNVPQLITYKMQLCGLLV